MTLRGKWKRLDGIVGRAGCSGDRRRQRGAVRGADGARDRRFGVDAGVRAARLAWLACGGTVDEVCRTPDVARVAEPDPALAAALQPRYERFQRLYTALRSEFS